MPADRLASGVALALLGVLTLVAFALRLDGIDQTLYADEDFTYYIVARNDLGGVWDAVYETSITPPFHYALAWLSLKLPGDDTVLVRLPSLVFGTALVPLVYALARQVGDRVGGLLAATLIGLSPIRHLVRRRGAGLCDDDVPRRSLHHGPAPGARRGRPYLVGGPVVAGCAALWSHYTAVFVIVAQAAWAIWARRDQLRSILIAQGLMALGFLPWLPGFIQQRQNKAGVGIIGEFGPLKLGTVFELPLRTLVGHPYFGLRDFPARGASWSRWSWRRSR